LISQAVQAGVLPQTDATTLEGLLSTYDSEELQELAATIQTALEKVQSAANPTATKRQVDDTTIESLLSQVVQAGILTQDEATALEDLLPSYDSAGLQELETTLETALGGTQTSTNSKRLWTPPPFSHAFP
jgi:capsule polysaccharide export protein KpsE/RkpR